MLEWPVADLDPLSIRMLEGYESRGVQTFMVGVIVALAGMSLSGLYGLVIGGMIMALAPWARKRDPITFLLLGPETEDGDLLVLFSNPDRRRVEKLKQAIEIARSWSKKNGKSGEAPKTGD